MSKNEAWGKNNRDRKNELSAKVEEFASTCGETGCSKDAHSSGKCITHYQQMRRGRKETTASNAKGKYKN